MPMNAQMEKGHLYAAEGPSHIKHEMGEGATIKMGSSPKGGNAVPMERDSSLAKVQAEHAHAMRAHSKFGRPK